MRELRSSVIRDSLSGYAVLFSNVLPQRFLRRIDPTSRQRSFGHVPVFWAWLAQILEGNASCQRALGLLQAWYQACELPVPGSGTSGYCQGRLRLTTDFLHEGASPRARGSCDGLAATSTSGTGCSSRPSTAVLLQLSDTPANQQDYPQPSCHTARLRLSSDGHYRPAQSQPRRLGDDRVQRLSRTRCEGGTAHARARR